MTSREIVTVPVTLTGVVEDRSGPCLVGAELPPGETARGHHRVGALLAGDTSGDQLVEDGSVQVVALGVGRPDHVGQRRAAQKHLSRDVAHDDGVGRSVEDGLEQEPTLVGGTLRNVTFRHVDEVGDESLELSGRPPFQGVDGLGFPPVLRGRVAPKAQEDLPAFPVGCRPLHERVTQMVGRVGMEPFHDEARRRHGLIGRDPEQPVDVGTRIRKALCGHVEAQGHDGAGGEDVLELGTGAVTFLGPLAQLSGGVEESRREPSDLVAPARHLDRGLATLEVFGGPLQTAQSPDDPGGEQLRHHDAPRQGQYDRGDGDGGQEDVRRVDVGLLAHDDGALSTGQRRDVAAERVGLELRRLQQGPDRRGGCRRWSLCLQAGQRGDEMVGIALDGATGVLVAGRAEGQTLELSELGRDSLLGAGIGGQERGVPREEVVAEAVLDREKAVLEGGGGVDDLSGIAGHVLGPVVDVGEPRRRSEHDEEDGDGDGDDHETLGPHGPVDPPGAEPLPTRRVTHDGTSQREALPLTEGKWRMERLAHTRYRGYRRCA